MDSHGEQLGGPGTRTVLRGQVAGRFAFHSMAGRASSVWPEASVSALQDMYYFPTREETIYKPDQVTTKGKWGSHGPVLQRNSHQLRTADLISKGCAQQRECIWKAARAHRYALWRLFPAADGAAVITIEKKSSVGITQQPDGEKLKWAKDYTSGFMEGWNKFCYT